MLFSFKYHERVLSPFLLDFHFCHYRFIHRKYPSIWAAALWLLHIYGEIAIKFDYFINRNDFFFFLLRHEDAHTLWRNIFKTFVIELAAL